MVVAPKEDATAPSRPQQHCTGCSGRWVVTFQRSCSPGLIRSATSQCSEMPSNCPGEGAPPHPPQVVPLLLEEADGHSRRFSLHHGSHEGEHTTRIIFSSPVVPWGRQNCPATQLRRRWRGGRGGGAHPGDPADLRLLAWLLWGIHQRHRSWATAWISPHLSVLMPSILPPLNHPNSTQNLANCWLFTKHIYKHSFKENSHGCK